jgi:hypothetical protein
MNALGIERMGMADDASYRRQMLILEWDLKLLEKSR